jgi:hypothetical protein
MGFKITVTYIFAVIFWCAAIAAAVLGTFGDLYHAKTNDVVTCASLLYRVINIFARQKFWSTKYEATGTTRNYADLDCNTFGTDSDRVSI